MSSREKVMKGLECIAQKREPTANPCKGCGYSDRPNYAICVKDIAFDALELLKEQDEQQKQKQQKKIEAMLKRANEEYMEQLNFDYMAHLNPF